jgi:HSP20 family protein
LLIHGITVAQLHSSFFAFRTAFPQLVTISALENLGPAQRVLSLGITMMPKNQTGLISFPLHVSREVERLFDDIIHRPWGVCREIRGWNPSLDLYETNNAFIVEADLPGVKSEDVQIEIDDGDLVLRGSRSLEKKYDDGLFHAMERSSGHFVRRIHLTEPVDKDALRIEYCDGVLRTIIPKSKGRRADQNHEILNEI